MRLGCQDTMNFYFHFNLGTRIIKVNTGLQYTRGPHYSMVCAIKMLTAIWEAL